MIPCCGDRENKKGLTARLPRSAAPPGEKGLRPRTESDEQKDAAPEEDTTPVEPFGQLTVKIVKGEGLKGNQNAVMGKVSEKKTLDAMVRLSINDGKPFAHSEMKAKSKGDPSWDEAFKHELVHPKSYLVVTMCDGEGHDLKAPVGQETPVGGLHVSDEMLFKNTCGYVEIPLWQMPINQAVTGWFTLRPPHAGTIADHQAEIALEAEEIAAKEAAAKEAAAAPADGDKNGNGKKKEEKKDAPEDKGCGRIRLEIMLTATKGQEFHAYLKSAAPDFNLSLPALDLKEVIDNGNEIKRLCLERLLLPPVKSVQYALSWKNKKLSGAILAWHFWICWHYTWLGASFFFALLFLFKHEKEEEVPEQPKVDLVGGAGRVGDKFKDAGGALLKKPTSVSGFFGGVTDCAKGVGDGVLQVGKEGLATTKGALDTVASAGSSGSVQLQGILRIKPEWTAAVTSLQPKLKLILKILHKIDDLVYFKEPKKTKKVIGAIGGAIVACIIFRPHYGLFAGTRFCKAAWIWFFMGWGWVPVGACIIMFSAPWFKQYLRMGLAAKGVLTRPKAPFPKACHGELWFVVAT